MATLTSPGVSVTVIDQSNYAPTGPGTVPFILLATATDKTSTAGGIAGYTTEATVNTLQLISSQKDLLTNYGLPIFPTDASGNRLFGSEIAEYGLMAAHSTLGITNQAYVLRANLDLSQLSGSSSRPSADPAGGTQWLNTSTSSYGIFEWDYATETFNAKTPTVITDSDQLTGGGIPVANIGIVGSYAINAVNTSNPIYRKAYDGSWNQVGSNAWAIKTPTLTGNAQASTLSAATALTINGNTFTISNTSVANLVATINSSGLPGINAQLINGYFNLFANASARSGNISSAQDGKIAISNSSGNPLSALGLTPGTYWSPALSYGAHYNVPAWKSTDSEPHPTGSIWLKTTAINGGANFKVSRYNSSTSTWDSLTAPVYVNRKTATYNLSPTLGGLGLSNGSLFVMYDMLGNNTGTYKLLEWNGDGTALTVTGATTNPSFVAGETFTVQTTSPASNSYSSSYTITMSGTTASSFVTDVLTANVPYLSASVVANAVVLSHTAGGDILLTDTSGTPIADAGITTSLDNVFNEDGDGTLTCSYWWPATTLYQQSTQPVVAPDDGTYWYYSTPLEVDIMISNGTNWRGYKNVSSDARGYNLGNTDPLGPQIQATAPTKQSDGTALVYGDLWVDTSDLENYPKIYRWQSVTGTDQWVQIDNTDDTTENGILFQDARWDTDGTTDPALDAKPTIVSLLTSNYLDLDAPDPALYPRGMLLFNTRRSSYNVKQFKANKFNSATYPDDTLPAVASTWQTVSGSNTNNVPYMGRKAVRNVVVSKLKAAVDTNTAIREDQINFNLLVCPGYPELTTNLIALNNDRRNTGFIIADTPMGLASDTSSVSAYVTNTAGTASTDEDGLATSDSYTAVFYPGAAYTNALDGGSQVVVPITHAILRMIIKSDQASAPWFAPAGSLRGKIDNVIKIGYLDRVSGKFYSIGTNQGLRDLLYTNNVNPVAVFPTEGIVNYGNHTRQATATALDRINVARLINYLRYNLERIAKPLVFEPNDTVTRNTATNAVAALLNDVKTQRGVYDYLVVCDTTNNTPSTIDQNELHIDIAIEPTKAVEFIYIPVRILNTGAIAGTNADQGGLSNITPSVTLGT